MNSWPTDGMHAPGVRFWMLAPRNGVTVALADPRSYGERCEDFSMTTSGAIDPTPGQIAAFAALPVEEGPIHMINLLRFRARAAYAEGDRGKTGQEAYMTYGASAIGFVQGVGGRQVWAGRPALTLIGPEGERWDLAVIVEYPNAAAFLKMVSDPAYQAIVEHRAAALEDSRLIRTSPIG